MDKVSDGRGPLQVPRSWITAFDPPDFEAGVGRDGGDGPDDADEPDSTDETPLAPPDAHGDGPGPDAPAGASAAVVIRCVKGTAEPRPGYSVYAVSVRRDDDADEYEVLDAVSIDSELRWPAAFRLAAAVAGGRPLEDERPERRASRLAAMSAIKAVRVIINDGRGLTHWWLPIAPPRLAA